MLEAQLEQLNGDSKAKGKQTLMNMAEGRRKAEAIVQVTKPEDPSSARTPVDENLELLTLWNLMGSLPERHRRANGAPSRSGT